MHMVRAANPCRSLVWAIMVEPLAPVVGHGHCGEAGDYGELPHPDSIDVNTTTRYLSAIPVDAVWQAVQNTYLV